MTPFGIWLVYEIDDILLEEDIPDWNIAKDSYRRSVIRRFPGGDNPPL